MDHSRILQKALRQDLLCGAISLKARIHRSRHQRWRWEWNYSPLPSSDSLVKFLLPVAMTIRLEVLDEKEGMLPSEDTSVIPPKSRLRLAPGHFGYLLFLNQ